MSFVEKDIIETTMKKIGVKCWRVHDAIWTDAKFDEKKAKAMLLDSVLTVNKI